MIKSSLLAIALLISTLHASATTAGRATALNITTINLEWYGLGGEISGVFSDEYRDEWIKEFFKNEKVDQSDVIVFEEIVDVNRLAKNVLGKAFKCYSYENENPKHQHVVLCHSNKFTFDKEDGDNNYIDEGVAIDPTRSRPAISGVLKNADGKDIVHIIGLHLKSGSKDSETRYKQAHAIVERINSFNDKTPAIVIGDYNVHVSAKSGVDDVFEINKIFKNAKLKLNRVENKFYTYKKGFFQGFQPDQAWVSEGITIKGQPKVGAACNTTGDNGERYENTSFYNRFVSDHCPLTIQLSVK